MAEYIEREAAKEYLFRSIGADPEGVCKTCIRDEYNCQYDRSWTLMDFCEKIENIGYVPAADVAPVRHGRWFMRGGKWRCSECDQKALLRLSDATGGCREYEYYRANYCPNCGAKMDKEKE